MVGANTRQYQHEIDGLRAIAVLAVLFFHFKIPGFSGGFVGVDVFFVISGYLISKNVYTDLQREEFSFSVFYLSRAFRLLPALFVTIAATIFAAYFVLTPEHFSQLGLASAASVFSVSNVLFWSQSGYFDEAKLFKPLLHTWSLGVEEQFYLLWPLLLVSVLPRGRKFCISMILILGVISLVAAQSLVSEHGSMVFYWMPFRISEFAIGACLIFLKRPEQQSLAYSIAAAVGLLLIIVPIFVYNDQTLFPGLMAMVPCLGTALLIYCAQVSFVSPVLSNSLSRYLGKTSYSLYLVHWPVIVLASYWKLGGIGAKSIAILIPFTFVLAWVLHYQVEQRFRRTGSSFKTTAQERARREGASRELGLILCALLLSFLGAGILLGKGWEWRYSDQAKPIIIAVSGLSEDHKSKKALLAQYQSSFRDKNGFDQHYIIGDSFAGDTMLAIKFSKPELNLTLLSIPAKCQPLIPGEYGETASLSEFCNRFRSQAYKTAGLENAKIIYLAASWREPALSNLTETINFLKSKTKARIVVFGPRAGFHDVPTLAVRFAKKSGLDQFVNNYKTPVDVVADKLKVLSEQTGAEFIDTYQLMCPNDMCIIISPADSKIVYSDYAHLTLSGAQYLGEKLTLNTE